MTKLSAAVEEKRRFAERAEALQLVIDAILVTWRAYANRIQWVMDHAAQQQQEAVNDKQVLDFMREFYANEVVRCEAQFKEREGFLRSTRALSVQHAIKISELLSPCEAARLASGYEEPEARYLAYRDLFDSKDAEIQELRKTQNDYDELIDLRKEELARAEHELAAFQGLQRVFQLVERHRLQSLQVSPACVDSPTGLSLRCLRLNEQAATESLKGLLQRATEAAGEVVMRLLPMLMSALKTAFECHFKRQQKALEELDETSRVLNEHLDIFGLSTPKKRQRVNEEMEEFRSVLAASQRNVTAIVKAQELLWLRKKVLLPSSVVKRVMQAYTVLTEELDGQPKEVSMGSRKV